MYRKHGDEEAQNLTEEQIKLIEIALLFHDSAREDDNEDKWDHESALFLYHYLTQVLRVDPQWAKFIAEATANKDPSPEQGYFEIAENEYGDVFWRFLQYEEGNIPPKNIFQKIIHDCDCLDIIRARNQFDARHLDFYKDIASKHKNEMALEEMAQLIIEARSLIHIQGDTFISSKEELKLQYENAESFTRIITDVNPVTHPILFALHQHLLPVEELQNMELIRLKPYDENDGMVSENLAAALREGRILARGITTPSAMPESRVNKDIITDETLAEKEIRKTMRDMRINTKSRKQDPKNKQGNPLRSTSILGYGSGVYPAAGMLIFNPEISKTRKISAKDFDSGRGAKNHLAHLQDKEFKDAEALVEKERDKLHRKMKLGLFGKKDESGSNYVEILYDITQYDAIFYTPDPTLGNHIAYNEFDAAHRFSPLLQAVYLQKQYEKQYELTLKAYLHDFGEKGEALFMERWGQNKTLPIFEYSGIHNRLIAINPDELTEEKIIGMWLAMCSAYMSKTLHDFEESLYEMSVDDIKIMSMYQFKENSLAKMNQPADLNYSEELRTRLNKAINEEKQKIIYQHEQNLLEKFNRNELSLFSKELFLTLQSSPQLRVLMSERIKENVSKYIQENPVFSRKELGAFSQIFSIVNLGNLDNVAKLDREEREALCMNQTLQAYCLCKQIGMEEEATLLRDRTQELAQKILSEWNAKTPDNPGQVINLKKFLTLIEADEETLQDVDQKLLEILSKKAAHCESYPNTVSSFSQEINKLYRTGFLNEKFHAPIRMVYEKRKEQLSDASPNDVITLVELSKYIGLDPQHDLTLWLKNYHKEIYSDIHQLIRTLEGTIVFDEDNIELFKLLIDKIHYNDSNSSYVNFSYWLRRMNDLSRLVQNHEFSLTQRAVIQERFHQLAEHAIKSDKEEVNCSIFSRDESDNFKMAKYLLSISVDINAILKNNFLLPLPDCFINEFNTALIKLSESNYEGAKLSKENIFTLKQLHKRLPNQELRKQSIEKLEEYLNTLQPVEDSSKLNQPYGL